MRKRMILGSILTMTVLAAGCGKQISMDQAKTIALEDAGLAADAVTFTRERQDEDEYELRFQTENEKYEYEVSRRGGIESKSKEMNRTD